MYFLWKAFNLFGNLICVNHRAVFDAKAINSVRLDLTAKSLYFKTHITAATVFINAVVCRLSS